MSKQVLAIGYTYVPDDPRVIAEAATAAGLGYTVDAIGVAKGGQASGDTIIDGIRVRTLPLMNTPGKALRILPDWVRGRIPATKPTDTNTSSNLLSIFSFYVWLLRLTLFGRYDIIHAHDHQVLPVGWLLSILKRRPWIYDAHEYVPGSHSIHQTFKARMAMRVEQFFLRRAHVVITVGSRLAANLQQRGAKRTVIIGNWKQAANFTTDPALLAAKRAAYKLDRFKLVVSYFGRLTEERQTDILLDAITALDDVALLLAGRGDFRQRAIDLAAHHQQIIWLDWLPYTEVPLYTMLGDVVFACLKPVSGNPDYMAPNKLFDAFTAGRALIARRGLGEIGAILEDESAAILLDEVTPQTVREALIQLRDNPDLLQQLQANAQDASNRYNWDVAVERLRVLYGDLTANRAQNR